jgi:steroid 5-alpha reductase family enzyme
MNSSSQPVPLVVILSAVMFTALNGHLQCFYLGHVEKLPPLILSASNINMSSAQTLLGIMIFLIGMGINIHSDGVLRNLRSQNKETDTTKQRRYFIPQGASFAYTSCPNFAGEIIEWFGFAIASHYSLASVAFFCYTASNLIPRGIAHHEWYKSKFEDYPAKRKWAVIPFIA